jgi:hypothetical protein
MPVTAGGRTRELTPPWCHRGGRIGAGNSDGAVTAPARMSAVLPLPCIGIGIDVRALEQGRPLWVTGLHWPYEPARLTGDSDGDVVVHACLRRPDLCGRPRRPGLELRER